MSGLRIQSDHIELMMRQCVASGTSAAVSRFRDRLGECDEGTVSRIAQAAAEIAIEQFKAYINNELSLIRADHEFRFNIAMLRPPEKFFVAKD